MMRDSNALPRAAAVLAADQYDLARFSAELLPVQEATAEHVAKLERR